VNSALARKYMKPKIKTENAACPCCGFKTLSERNTFEICAICFWEDDGQNDSDADIVRGGPNHSLSLTEARKNFKEFGACDRERMKYVRKPKPSEK
jgi:hypothetical protein